MFSRWIVTNITSASVTTFLAFLAGIISWSVYCSGMALAFYHLLQQAYSFNFLSKIHRLRVFCVQNLSQRRTCVVEVLSRVP
jgi:hypothetical protein